MSEAIYIYLYIVFGNLVEGVALFTFFSGLIISLLTLVSVLNNYEFPTDEFKEYKIHRWVYVLILSLSLIALYPTKEDLKYIVGGAVLLNMVNSDEVKKLPTNVLKAINSFLESIKTDAKST